ncbi:MAG: molybdopterin molybdotransferase MoeA [Lentisphaeria bacterium]|nr:molybdopterin molybdotransferase MoeA [Lentisphaeria bacterium]
MISVDDAQAHIDKSIYQTESESVTLSKAHGRLLRETIHADRDMPPFHRVAMDGIAICLESWKNGNTSFVIEGIVPAGSETLTLQENNACIEVMTGCVLPIGTNCVIRVEDISINEASGDRIASLGKLELTDMQNVHQQGTDNANGDVLLEKGRLIRSAQIAVLSSVGKSSVLVSKRPSVAIIATGDELVEVDKTPLDHQIRMSNIYAIFSALEDYGIEKLERYHITDDKESLREKLKTISEEFDILIMSGGVSMGKFDYVPEILDELNIEKQFHKVAQRPGKPFWFGTNETTRVFALPGNPVSTIVCFHRYVMPFIRKCIGYEVELQKLELAEDLSFRPNLTLFQPVTAQKHLAIPVKLNGSGDFCGLARTSGFIELPANTELHKKGGSYTYYPI